MVMVGSNDGATVGSQLCVGRNDGMLVGADVVGANEGKDERSSLVGFVVGSRLGSRERNIVVGDGDGVSRLSFGRSNGSPVATGDGSRRLVLGIVGIEDGDVDGTTVGTSVGIREGTRLGFKVGPIVGVMVLGVELGEIDGSTVVGAKVGRKPGTTPFKTKEPKQSIPAIPALVLVQSKS